MRKEIVVDKIGCTHTHTHIERKKERNDEYVKIVLYVDRKHIQPQKKKDRAKLLVEIHTRCILSIYLAVYRYKDKGKWRHIIKLHFFSFDGPKKETREKNKREKIKNANKEPAKKHRAGHHCLILVVFPIYLTSGSGICISPFSS